MWAFEQVYMFLFFAAMPFPIIEARGIVDRWNLLVALAIFVYGKRLPMLGRARVNRMWKPQARYDVIPYMQ
jgi:hypothetical protein